MYMLDTVCTVVQLSDTFGVWRSGYKVSPVFTRWGDKGLPGEQQGEIGPALHATVSLHRQIHSIMGNE